MPYVAKFNFLGGVELLDTLLADKALMANANAKAGLESMGVLFRLLKAYKALDRVWLFRSSSEMPLMHLTDIL